MINYCSIEYLNILVNSKISKIKEYGFSFDKYKEIPYGVQLFFTFEGKKYILNLYYTQKKGFKIVTNIKGEDENNKILIDIFNDSKQEDSSNFNNHNFKTWIGTDESGKGDYFGPLVTAGFLIDKDIINDIQKLGVKDSKQLSDEKITKIAKYLYETYPNRISTCKILPYKYNELYDKMVRNNKNLNHLLAWAHARVIENLLLEHKYVDGIIVDQFANECYMKNALMEKGQKVKLIQRHRAEQDLAVASASIIARYIFVNELNKLSIQYGMNFNKGAGEGVNNTAVKFVKKYGKEKLYKVAKVHFKTTEKILKIDL